LSTVKVYYHLKPKYTCTLYEYILDYLFALHYEKLRECVYVEFYGIT